VSDKQIEREADQLKGINLPEQSKLLIGHEIEFNMLEKQIVDNRLPSAILLHGIRGIGKATFAFALAKKILHITGNEQLDIINQQVYAGSHPNLFVLRISAHEKRKGFYSAIRIEDVRAMQRKLRLFAGVSAYKICIIDAIDDCNINSANALLKILEEPPKDTIFILISHSIGSILPTIRSRTQSVALRTLNNAQLSQILQNSNFDIEHHSLQNTIDLAKGVPRRAIQISQLEGEEILVKIQNWLNSAQQRHNSSHIELVSNILKAGSAEENFAKDILLDWIASEAKNIAIQTPINKNHLASITNLWNKSQKLFAKADIYNLDRKQVLISTFDAIKAHLELITNNRSVELT